MILTTDFLFDSARPFEQRLLALVAWIEAKRAEPVSRDAQLLIAHLLATDAIALPLHLVFPDEAAMDLSLLHPSRLPADELSIDDVQVENFIWRHTGLDRQIIAQLTDAELKYEAILGMIDWEVAFETEAAYQAAVAHYEIVTQHGPDGALVHEQDVFWYVAARDYGISREDAEAFSRHKLIYLFAHGIASDDVGLRLLDVPA